MCEMTRTEGISVGVMTRTEGISVGVIRMLCQPVTRTAGISVRVIRMRSQLVGFGSVERANVKFTKKCILLMEV